jgi:hypothetical protein
MPRQASWPIVDASPDLSQKKYHCRAVESRSRLCGSVLGSWCVMCIYLEYQGCQIYAKHDFDFHRVYHTRFCLWRDEDQFVWRDPNHVTCAFQRLSGDAISMPSSPYFLNASSMTHGYFPVSLIEVCQIHVIYHL